MATLYGTKLGRVMLIIQREQQTTNFGRANDRLSRAASELNNKLQALYEGYAHDKEFDGGEWSGPATGRAVRQAYEDVAEKYKFPSAEAMMNKLYTVCSPKWVYNMFGGYMPSQEAATHVHYS